LTRYDYSPETTGITVRIVGEPEPIREPQGAKAQRAIDHRTDTVGQLALALKVIDGLLDMLGTNAAMLDTFKTDHRIVASIRRDGNKYDVRRQS
jgi:hypothetical protein